VGQIVNLLADYSIGAGPGMPGPYVLRVLFVTLWEAASAVDKNRDKEQEPAAKDRRRYQEQAGPRPAAPIEQSARRISSCPTGPAGA
jgi:hypothetical protein